MSTRSNVVIKENGKQIVRVYRQCDGYPTGMGTDIKAILSDGQSILTNGYGTGQMIPAVFNGMGCLAAYLIGELKNKKIGNVYIDGRTKLGKDDFDIEWEYILSSELTSNEEVPGKILFEVRARRDGKYVSLYRGTLKNFDAEKVEKLANGEVTS